MELWIADIFDYSFEAPYLIGVYATEQQAWDAIRIVIDRSLEKGASTMGEERFHPTVTPVQLNGFAPACMDWLGCE
jgi:hypothetical protein